MSVSDTIASGGVATFTVKVAGTTIPDEARVLSISIKQAINQIPTANIIVLDGQASTGKFEASSASTFLPGEEITIEAGYDFKNKEIFKGIITKQTIRIDSIVGSALEVQCRDKAVKMIVGRKSLTFSKQKDSDIISSIIGKYSGISSQVSPTETEWPEQVQYYVTDWDFILTRAESNAMVAIALNGKLSIQKPDANSSSVLTLKYGDNLLEFNGELNSISQFSKVKAQAWDFKTQAIISAEASNEIAGAGNLSSKKLSEVLGLSDYDLQTSAYQTTDELATWSKAQMVKSEFSKIMATASCQGTALVEPGKYLSLEGLGDRISGDHLISEVFQEFSQGNWITEIGLGLANTWFSEEPDVMAPPAAGLLPGARGLFNGTVKKMYEDPDNQYRILVDIPLFDQNGEGIWARLANFYSSSGAGVFFLPEVGDEVVLGFLSEDPRYPIILGSLYSADKNKPFEGLDPNEKNSMKAIVSKTGIYLEFDDENKVLSISTPNKNTVVLSDKSKEITLKDENGNSIEMNESGITIKSPKNITIQADQNLEGSGVQGIKLESTTGDVSTSGMNVKVNADMQYSAEGGEMAAVKAGAELTLNAGMIMIN